MAYKNLVLQDCTSKAEVFCRIRDFVCARAGTYDYSTSGIGWTLHDSSYAVDENNPELGDWVVFKSTGENTKERMYFMLTWKLGYLSAKGFLYWDNVLHSGVTPYQTSDYTFNLTDGLTAYNLSIYGDIDFVICFEKLSYSSGGQKVFFGKTEQMLYDDTPCISADQVAAGAGVVVTLDFVPSDWGPGKKVFVLDEEKINIETITSVSGLTVTLDIANSYLAGFAMQGDIGYCASSSTSAMSASFLMSHLAVVGSTYTSSIPAELSSLDPDGLSGGYGTAAPELAFQGSYGGRLRHVAYISITGLVDEDFLVGDLANYRFFDTYTADIVVKEV